MVLLFYQTQLTHLHVHFLLNLMNAYLHNKLTLLNQFLINLNLFLIQALILDVHLVVLVVLGFY